MEKKLQKRVKTGNWRPFRPEDSHFSEEGHYGVPDIYEDGGDGTGGAFDSLVADENDDEDR